MTMRHLPAYTPLITLVFLPVLYSLFFKIKKA